MSNSASQPFSRPLHQNLLAGFVLVLGLASFAFEVNAQTLIDWTHAETNGWVDGQLTNTFEGNAGGVDVDYVATPTGNTIFSTQFGANPPEILNHADVGYAFTGGGPDDDYLDLFITNDDPGDGVINTFTFSDAVSNASLVIWDIDAAAPAGDNYVDELIITATLTNGAVVAPTSSTITNPSFVTQTSADTWRAIPYNAANDLSDEGNLSITFAYANIETISVYYGNSPIIDVNDTRSGPADTHAIGIHNFGMSGLSTPDSQIVLDTTGITGPTKSGDNLDGTADSNGGAQTLDFGNVFVNDIATDTAVSIDVESLGNEATTYSVNTTGAASVSGADGSLSELGGADETDTITGSLTGTGLGSITGTLTLDNTDGSSPTDSNGPTASSRFGIYDDNDAITMNATAYAHSNGSFDSATDQNSTTVGFGNYTGGATPSQNIEIHNLPTSGNTTYTVDMRYDAGTATGDSGQFDLSNIVAAEDITAGNSTGPVSIGFTPNALGDFSAEVILSSEDHNLTPLGLETSPDHNGSGPNVNDDPAGLTVTVTGTALDSQVTFDTDTSDGAGSNGQQTNGSTTAINLGNAFLGTGTFSQPVGTNNTGNENTTFDVFVGSGDALINGGTAALNNQAATGNATPSVITQATTFNAGLDSSTLGAKSGTIVLSNDDATTAISGLDQGNGTGTGYGAEDVNDTLNLSGAVYAHSNGSFDSGSDQNSTTVNFGNYTGGATPTQNIEVHNLPTNGNTTYTVDMRYDAGSPTGDSGQFDLSNVTAAEDIAAGGSTGPISVGFTPTALGDFSADVVLSPEDHNLTPLGLETSSDHNGSGPNVNDDPGGITATVTGTALDSQVTFDTDTSDGAGSNGQRTNGSSTNLALGNFFLNAAVSQAVGVNNTGNENTTFDLAIGSGDALINGGVTPLLNQAATGQNPPADIAQGTTFAAGLDSSVTGAISGTIELGNDDSTTAISGLDQGNGTGTGYGAEDATDTLSLAASIYEHSNSSFTNGVIDTNSLTIDFGTVGADTGTYNSNFSVFNLPGLDTNFTVNFESSSIAGDTSYLFTNLSPIDGLGAGSGNAYLASFDTSGLTPGLYSTTITISGLDDGDHIALLNLFTGGADLPTGYDPGDLTLNLQGEVVPEPSTGILLSLFGLVWLFRRPRRAVKG